MLVCWFLSVTEILPWMFYSRLKIHAPGESALLQWQAGSRGLILLHEVKEGFRDMHSQDRREEKKPLHI